LCPICKGRAQEVKCKTVKHFVVDGLLDKVKEGTYNICLNEDCDVIYFNVDQDLLFNKDNIKIPIWFKKNADPKYICYCNKVTEQQIYEAVINGKAKDMKDIIKLTGAMKNSKCEIMNPLGQCCGSEVQQIIDKALIME
jgi:bacterioferritin-associated ferredoxin